MYAALDNNKKKDAHIWRHTCAVLLAAILFMLLQNRIWRGGKQIVVHFMFFLHWNKNFFYFSLPDSYGILLQTYQKVDDDGDGMMVVAQEKK